MSTDKKLNLAVLGSVLLYFIRSGDGSYHMLFSIATHKV
jgi:hypothetical protein